MNLSEETVLLAFKAISNFVSDLCQEYGARHKPLQLYNRLVSKTSITHEKAIQKHIEIFKHFCVENRLAILRKDNDMLKLPRLSYSERVYIDIAHVMNLADTETLAVIWSHLLTISAILDPGSKARETLREDALREAQSPPTVSGSGGGDFMADLLSKVEKNVKPGATPMDAISGILQSGIFGDLLSGLQKGMQNGQLDIGKMLGSVQGLIAKMGEENKDDPEAKQSMDLLNNLTKMTGGDGQAPDLSGMLNTVMSSLSQQAKKPASVEEVPVLASSTVPANEVHVEETTPNIEKVMPEPFEK